MKNISALLLSGALCLTSVPVLAIEQPVDEEEVTSVYSVYDQCEGWLYNAYIKEKVVMPVPCSGTINIKYVTFGSGTVKVTDSSGNVLATMKSSAEDQENYTFSTKSISVKKGTYYLEKSGSFPSEAAFEPSESYSGWQFNGYSQSAFSSGTGFKPTSESEIWYYCAKRS